MAPLVAAVAMTGLVARFKGVEIPATGMSIGVSRLYTALQALARTGRKDQRPRARPGHGQGAHRRHASHDPRIANSAGIRTEMYVGGSGMRAQMKYADKRAAPCVIIQGSDEFVAGEVTIKDLVKGSQMSKEIDRQ